ncbi:hypothetical protein AB1Y20_021515 [Prymnesium parvum]|uniref:Aquaporin n=1 Tax=Prymnesium parvum TaxID=97485 RepID=A0AB34JIY1_PRYPA
MWLLQWLRPPPPPPEPLPEASSLPLVTAALLCWFLPAVLVTQHSERSVAAFAIVEFVAALLGNGLFVGVELLTAHWSEAASELALQLLLFVLLVVLYFPMDGHMNAALTAGAWACGQCTLKAAALFVAAQLFGSALAMELMELVVDPALREHIRPPHPPYIDEGIWAAILFELVCTFLMVLLYLGCTELERFDKHYVLTSGLVVALVRYTGASMDPLGAFSAALFAEDYIHQLEVYWFGSLAGGLLAGLVWRVLESYLQAKRV